MGSHEGGSAATAQHRRGRMPPGPVGRARGGQALTRCGRSASVAELVSCVAQVLDCIGLIYILSRTRPCGEPLVDF